MQVAEEQVGRRGVAVHPLRPVLHRTLADVQERLTFRAQAFIKVTVNLHLLSIPHAGSAHLPFLVCVIGTALFRVRDRSSLFCVHDWNRLVCVRDLTQGTFCYPA